MDERRAECGNEKGNSREVENKHEHINRKENVTTSEVLIRF